MYEKQGGVGECSAKFVEDTAGEGEGEGGLIGGRHLISRSEIHQGTGASIFYDFRDTL